MIFNYKDKVRHLVHTIEKKTSKSHHLARFLITSVFFYIPTDFYFLCLKKIKTPKGFLI